MIASFLLPILHELSGPQSLQPLIQNSLVINTAYLVYLGGLLKETMRLAGEE